MGRIVKAKYIEFYRKAFIDTKTLHQLLVFLLVVGFVGEIIKENRHNYIKCNTAIRNCRIGSKKTNISPGPRQA
jgi:hypothetical protein